MPETTIVHPCTQAHETDSSTKDMARVAFDVTASGGEDPKTCRQTNFQQPLRVSLEMSVSEVLGFGGYKNDGLGFRVVYRECNRGQHRKLAGQVSQHVPLHALAASQASQSALMWIAPKKPSFSRIYIHKGCIFRNPREAR